LLVRPFVHAQLAIDEDFLALRGNCRCGEGSYTNQKRFYKPRSVNGKSWIEAKEADLVRDAAKSLDAEPSPSG
jgi:hypothetical protein